MSGFIGPDNSRVDRLDLLITEALAQMDRTSLSPEAQAHLADLESEDETRRERARRSAANPTRKTTVSRDGGLTWRDLDAAATPTEET